MHLGGAETEFNRALAGSAASEGTGGNSQNRELNTRERNWEPVGKKLGDSDRNTCKDRVGNTLP